MSSSGTFLRRWTIRFKMILISCVILVGLLVLGGIGFWISSYLTRTATNALHEVGEARSVFTQSTDAALQSEKQARQLGELASDLIALQQLVVEGTNRHRKGVTAESIIQAARDLAQKSELVRQVPGAEETIPGTKGITLADQVIGNFNDVVVLLEFELPDIYAETLGSESFVRKQGATVVGMTSMYWFISRTLGKLTDQIGAQVTERRADLQSASDRADLIAGAARKALENGTRQARSALLLTFLVTIVILAVLLIRFAGDIVFPLQKTVSMAKELKHGRVGSRLDVGRRNDEFADMAAALNAFAEDLQGEVVAALQALSQGNLNVKVFPFDDQDQVRAALQKTVNDLNALLGQVQTISERISLSSSQVASSSQTLSEGACRSASSLEQISASLNELSSQTRLNAENAMQADTLAGQANVLAQNGSGHMSDMMTAMEEINRASQNISKIIKVIDEIAFQTNLLALNAAVEAARAGQHGKGFAVVAEEVRSLAARSAKSAAETAQLIEGAVSKAQNGSKIADATAGALSEIVGVVGKVSGLVGDINAASREQAEGIAQVNASLAQIDQVTQQNTASAEESAAAAEELSAQAHQLRRMLAHFTLG